MRNTVWTTCGRKLLLDGKSFFIRGINYAPTPIGMPGRLDMLGHEEIFSRDLPNLRAMHANAVKTYDFYSDVDHAKYLDAAYNGGESPIYTIFSIWIAQSLMGPDHPLDDPKFTKMVEAYYEMAKLTSHHPGVLGYSIGGEMNSIIVIHDRSFWAKFQLLTDAVRRGIRENGAQKVITTTFVDDGGLSFTAGEHHHADVDLWGSNVYQTNYAGFVIPQYMRVPTDKPLLVSEYGYPYASNKGEGDDGQLRHVSNLLTRQTEAMNANFNLSDRIKEQILVGGFIFEYSDEWWKAGNANVHNLGLVANRGFPLGYLSEEYFGLYRVARGDGADELEARPTVEALRRIWGHGPLHGEGEDYSSCVHKATTTTTTTTTTSLNEQAPGAVGGLELAMASMAALIALGVLTLLAFVMYSTRQRRSNYRRLAQGTLPGDSLTQPRGSTAP